MKSINADWTTDLCMLGHFMVTGVRLCPGDAAGVDDEEEPDDAV